MSHLERAIADGVDRESWLLARADKIGASDAAKFSKLGSAPLYAKAKLFQPFTGNAATEHGNAREQSMLSPYGMPHNTTLFRSAANPRHVATPDGIKVAPDGSLILAEAKTTNKPFRTIPLNYMRQVWWAQYVLGAHRTLFIWEVHDSFIPTDMEPSSRWIERDDTQIATLVTIADRVLELLDAANNFAKELTHV